MRIIQVIPDFRIGGAEEMCKHLSISLKKHGHEVKIVSLYDLSTRNTADLEAEGFEISYLGKKPGLDFSTVKKLKKTIKEFRPDVIHSHLHALKYAYWASSRDCPIVHTIHNVATKDSGGLSLILNKLFLRSGRVKFVALSKAIQETIVDAYTSDVRDIPVVLNGVPIERYYARKGYDLKSPISIANVAGFRPAKNQIELLKAVMILQSEGIDCELFLYGDGEKRAEIEDFIKQNELDAVVRLCGFRNDVAEKLAESDIFVLPSLFEGIPLSLIEAMATAMPIVASNVGGIPDMIDDGETGLLCEPIAQSIAEKIQLFVSSVDLRATCGKSALKAASRFSDERMCLGYVDVYKSVIK